MSVIIGGISQTAISVISAGVGIVVTVLLWIADRYDVDWALKRAKGERITGRWYGWSVYIPVNGFFSIDREAIYKSVVDFKQRGRRLTFDETLTEIYDIDGRHLAHLAQRRFHGRGRIQGDFDISARFKERRGLTIGSMHLVADWRAHEITGILSVRPQIPGRPVAVKILLRRAGEPMPTWDELGVPLLKVLANAHKRQESKPVDSEGGA